jgi:hypothetical protein
MSRKMLKLTGEEEVKDENDAVPRDGCWANSR